MSSPLKKRPRESSSFDACADADSANDSLLDAEGHRLRMATEQQRLDERSNSSTLRRLHRAEKDLERDYKKQKTELQNAVQESKQRQIAIESAGQRLRFDQLCHDLRNGVPEDTTSAVSLTDTINDLEILYKGHAKPLGEALLASIKNAVNTNVTSLTIVPNMLLPLPVQDQRTAMSHAASVQALIRYIHGSTTLQSVRFKNAPEDVLDPNKRPAYDCVNEFATSLLLPAIRANAGIHSISFDRAPVQSLVLSRFLIAKTNLTSLHLDLERLDSTASDARSHVAEATRGLVALERLTLSGMLHQFALAVSILELVPTQRLQELDLRGGYLQFSRDIYMTTDCLQVLARIMRSTTSLQHLALKDFHFHAGTMNDLVACLYCTNGRLSSTTISKLTIDCTLDDEAADAFVDFMQTKLYGQNNGASSRQNRTSLRELHGMLGYTIPSIVSDNVQGLNGRIVASESAAAATIGSTFLHTASFSEMTRFCADEFIRMCRGIRHLHCLYLADMGASNCRDLARCLPHLPSLHTLHLTNVCDYKRKKTAKILLRMLRDNDSVGTFSAQTDVKQHARLFHKNELERVQAYMERNRFLMQLVKDRSGKKTKGSDDGSVSPNVQPPLATATTTTTIAPVRHYLLVPITTRLSLDKLLGVVSAMEHSSMDSSSMQYESGGGMLV